jgi:hypothetical protein
MIVGCDRFGTGVRTGPLEALGFRPALDPRRLRGPHFRTRGARTRDNFRDHICHARQLCTVPQEFALLLRQNVVELRRATGAGVAIVNSHSVVVQCGRPRKPTAGLVKHAGRHDPHRPKLLIG